ncbi:MAG TPA: ribosome maturation factor RimM [Solirubrobacteraceae bacterium]|nr:ribosome maturation factor RimM [Solirubrobacteraceae bacterium]
MLQAGRVGRPHGLDGSFHVAEPRPSLLDAGSFTLGGRCRKVTRRAGMAQRPILRLEGIDGREGAEAVRGEALLVDRGAAPELAEDEWFAEDLEGCRVTDGAREIGHVQRVLAYPSCELLEVGDLLVPLIRDAVRSVDLEARRIDVDLAFLGEA